MKFDIMDNAYPELIDYVEREGFWYSPRGQVCKEVRPASFILTDPTHALYTGEERRLNYRFAAIETLIYISGLGDAGIARLLCSANSNMKKYVNPETNTFDGFYGPRLKVGLDNAFYALKADPWTRQAVASIWNNREKVKTLDLPCTLSFNFFCTKDSVEYDESSTPKLNLSVTMRSNDLNWGMPYDVNAFCEILCCMAGCLGYEIGSYYHNVGSLHYYRSAPPECRLPEAEHKRADASLGMYRLPVSKPPEKQEWYEFVNKVEVFVEALLSYHNQTDRNTPYPWRDNMLDMIAKDQHNRTNGWSDRFFSLLSFRHTPK